MSASVRQVQARVMLGPGDSVGEEFSVEPVKEFHVTWKKAHQSVQYPVWAWTSG